MPINSPISWVGGKKALRDVIIACFPELVPRFIEVFGGGGWVLFKKKPSPFEVYNDFNNFLSNFFLATRTEPLALVEALNLRLNSRAEFDAVRALMKQTCLAYDGITPNIAAAANFYQLIRQSYASGLKSFAAQPHSLLNDFPLIMAAHHRLAGVIIENRSYEKILTLYDDENTLFYLDPPYLGTEDMYQNIGKEGFTMEDHVRLRDLLLSIEGKFILSYNKDPEILALYSAPGICVMPVERLHNMRQRIEPGAMYEEFLIANFDLYDAMNRFSAEQLNLFDVAH